MIIDGCTRMVVGFSFSLAESCVAVADALRIGIKHNGVPLMYYSDNGGMGAFCRQPNLDSEQHHQPQFKLRRPLNL